MLIGSGWAGIQQTWCGRSLEPKWSPCDLKMIFQVYCVWEKYFLFKKSKVGVWNFSGKNILLEGKKDFNTFIASFIGSKFFDTFNCSWDLLGDLPQASGRRPWDLMKNLWKLPGMRPRLPRLLRGCLKSSPRVQEFLPNNNWRMPREYSEASWRLAKQSSNIV